MPSQTTDQPPGTVSPRRSWAGRIHKEISMRSTILTAVALVLFSSAVMAQSTDTTNPPTTGPAAQSDSMSKGDMTKDKMSKKKMSKSEKMKKTHAKM
jgi:pentapeptide MXKDX repeat protein